MPEYLCQMDAQESSLVADYQGIWWESKWVLHNEAIGQYRLDGLAEWSEEAWASDSLVRSCIDKNQIANVEFREGVWHLLER